MKIIETPTYKESKCKTKKEWKTNPFAVCEVSVGKEEHPKKFQRCVKHVTEQQSESETEIKESQAVFTPEVEEEYANQQENIDRKRKQLELTPKKKPGRGLSRKQRQEEAARKQYMRPRTNWRNFVEQMERSFNLDNEEKAQLLMDKIRQLRLAQSEKK